MEPHSVQNSSLFPHLLVGMVAPARQALHTHRDPGEKKGGERRGRREESGREELEWEGGVRVGGRSESGREE